MKPIQGSFSLLLLALGCTFALIAPTHVFANDAQTLLSTNQKDSNVDTPDQGVESDAPAPLPAWVPKLHAAVTPTTVTLGGPVTVSIKLRHQQGISVALPTKLNLGKFEELAREDNFRKIDPKKEISDLEQTFTVKVAAYELGELTLPPIEVTVLGRNGELISLPTMAVPIKVKSTMGNEPDPKLKGVEPPVSVFERNWWLLYILIGLATIGVIVTATLLISRKMRSRLKIENPPPPPIPPHLIALNELDQLDVDIYIEKGQLKELYLRLSEIIRGYIGRLWNFDAMEMTTSEIDTILVQRRTDLSIRQHLDRFFDDCDLVKFAKHRPDADSVRRTADQAKAIVNVTMPVSTVQPIIGEERP
ncbi:MAG: BatD family protein [Pseudomonadota bacterium]